MRNLILALLAKQPAHGYELKIQIETALGKLWPKINVGQIYVTLKRLERDGLVRSETIEQSDRPDKKVFELTPAGHDALVDWTEEVDADYRIKDGFFLRLITAITVPWTTDVLGLIDRQRAALLRRVREVQLLTDDAVELTELLATEATLLHLQAELRWLEVCEQHVIEGVGKERT